MNKNLIVVGNTSKKRFSIGGKIIKDLGYNLPNMFVALNELIKNSYDACATWVLITHNSKNKSLQILDNGSGMTMDSIEVLLQISQSTKEYAKTNSCGRLTQGSKGLGFLSVFKFGDFVEWKTRNGKSEITLSVDYRHLEQLKELDKEDIDVSESIIDSEETFTKITIRMTNEQNTEFTNFFSDKANLNKILYSFSPDTEDFNITLNFDDVIYNSSKLPFSDIFNISTIADKQLYNVTYDNSSNTIVYMHNGVKLFEENYIMNLSVNSVSIRLNLNIYSFKSSDTQKVNPLFKHSQKSNKIFPIVYINNNIFFSESIFDPDISRAIKSSKSLPQMTGLVEIFTENETIEFNPQRTALVQTNFTNRLISELQKLNVFIQEKGSENKFLLLDSQKYKIIENKNLNLPFIDDDDYNFDFIFKYTINNSFKHTKLLTPVRINDRKYDVYFCSKLIGSINLPPLKKDYYSKAKIELKKAKDSIPINTQQIDLVEYIYSANNSKGELFDNFDSIDIYVDNVKTTTRIIETQPKPIIKKIRYEYNDQFTGLTSSILELEFFESVYDLKTSKKDQPLIFSPGNRDITLTFNNFVSNLVDQLNYLHSHKTIEIKGFPDIISISLRTLYELATYSFIKEYDLYNIFSVDPFKDNLTKMVEAIIKILRIGDKSIVSKIAESNSISYNTLNNCLVLVEKDTTLFGNMVKKSNIYTHTGLGTLGTEDIDNIARNLSMYLIIINSCVTNNEIKQKLKVPGLIERLLKQ